MGRRDETKVAPATRPDEDVEHQSAPKEKEQQLPSALRTSSVATALFGLTFAGHVGVLRAECVLTSDRGTLFWWLALVVASCAFESFVYAVGGLRRIQCFSVLEALGRVRLLLGSTTWAWLVPWSSELACRCGSSPPPQGDLVLLYSRTLAIFITVYFAVRELAFVVTGEPPSALDPAVPPKFGDCLPSNALLGGQFRLNKAELESSGRVVFVPARERKGLYASSGLALLAHCCTGAGLAGLRAEGQPPWLLLGGLLALLGRQLPQRLGGRAGAEDAWRLGCQAAELWWMWCCVKQLQACEAKPDWAASCG